MNITHNYQGKYSVAPAAKEIEIIRTDMSVLCNNRIKK
jgi:hypothetical protein